MRCLSPFIRLVLPTALVFAVGCGAPQESGSESTTDGGPGGDYTPVIAQIGDIQITQGYFDYRYETLSAGEKARFSGEDWEKRFMEALIDEMLMSIAAERENLHRVRDTQWRLDKARREILFQRYYQKHFQDELEIPEDELREHYEEYKDNYTMLGRVLVHHIQTADEESAMQAWEELQDGENFTVVAAKYSEDELTKDKHGTLGWVNPEGYVLGRGFDAEFTDYLFSLEGRSLYPPKKIGANWHIVKTGGKEEGTPQSFADARERVERELRPFFQRQAFESRRDELAQTLGLEYFGEFDDQEDRTAEELYRLAAESLNRYAKLDYYDALVENYPDDERADDALFMAGFVASEELYSPGEAAKYFRQLLEDHPDSEFRDDAHFMLGNLGGARPDLTQQGMPRTAEEASGRIGGIGQ